MSSGQHMRVIRGPLHDGRIQYERELIEEWWEIRADDGFTERWWLRDELSAALAASPLRPEEKIVHVRRYRLKKGKRK